MDKHIWRQVKTLSSSSHRPSSRWGHSSCVVGDQIVFFGGYADSTYMNDLWAFNSVTMKWRQIQTFGDIPCQRSNCSMNYDKENDQIIIFGGGGANKQRFNCISILNWKTKQWIEINPKQNQVAPWERTYHAAQYIHPYLIVFGGQGVADLDDLWIFSFITFSWTQVKIPADKVKPCARRFHSSVTIGNQFIILAGCHSKYRCLSDIFSLNITSLLQTGNFNQLEWKEKKMKNSSFLTRWGHSSAVYDNKIYIFGGRFSNDLNDLLVADMQTSTIKGIKTNEAPPARRRHCAGFIGSSMLVFGGFNGQYFQDLNYISVHEPKTKYEINNIFDQKTLLSYLNKKQLADHAVKSSEDQYFYINIGFISKYFDKFQAISQFLESINCQYEKDELQEIFTVLYTGYGQIKLKSQHKALLCQTVFEQKGQKINSQREKIQKSLVENPRKIFKKTIQNYNPLIRLEEELFTEYLAECHKSFFDTELYVENFRFRVNRIKLIAKSEYFYNLFLNTPNEQDIVLQNLLSPQSKGIYEILFGFLENDWLVVPENASIDIFMSLEILADYFCIPVLSQICCNELLNMITCQNVEKILDYSTRAKIPALEKACSDFWIKKKADTTKLTDLKHEINKIYSQKSRVVENLQEMLSKISFDLSQSLIQIDSKAPILKKQDSNVSVEKQNYQTNVYNH